MDQTDQTDQKKMPKFCLLYKLYTQVLHTVFTPSWSYVYAVAANVAQTKDPSTAQ